MIIQLVLVAVLCACSNGSDNEDSGRGEMRGMAKSAAGLAGEGGDGSMEGMYIYTIQKIEGLAEKLESLATKTVRFPYRTSFLSDNTSKNAPTSPPCVGYVVVVPFCCIFFSSVSPLFSPSEYFSYSSSTASQSRWTLHTLD